MTGRSRRFRWLLGDAQGWQPRLYEAFFTHTRWGRSLRAAEHGPISVLLSPYAGAGCRVLEFGAGTGAYTDLMARWGAQIEVREPSPSMRRYLRRRARRAWPSVTVVDGRLPHDPRTDHVHDLVVAVGVLNYMPDLTESLITLARCARDRGAVLINVPTDRPPGARYRWTELLGRRQVHRRSVRDVQRAALQAGLRIDAGPVAAGVTDIYRFLRDAP